MSRKSISDGTRYRILKRDKFRCRYCGEHGSEAELQVDHVQPVSAGGGNEPLNLTTACRRCNSGKRASVPQWTPCRTASCTEWVAQLAADVVPVSSWTTPNCSDLLQDERPRFRFFQDPTHRTRCTLHREFCVE